MVKNTKTKKIKIKTSDIFFLATLAYLSQFIENVFHDLIQWTPLIDVVPLGYWWWTLILRVLCVLSWGAVIYFIVKSSRKCGYDPIEKVKDVKPLEWIIPAVITLIFVGYFVWSDGGLGVLWSGLKNMGGFFGTVSYLVFLALQVALMMLVIALAQKGGELLFPKAWRYLPFGGIFLGGCMLIVNLISGLSSGALNVWVMLLLLAIQVLYGAVYVITGKRAILAYPFVYLMFFIL